MLISSQKKHTRCVSVCTKLLSFKSFFKQQNGPSCSKSSYFLSRLNSLSSNVHIQTHYTDFHVHISFYKITKIVCTLWLAERRVCMRVCKHGCDVKMFCFSCANHASTNLKKVLSWKTRQIYFIYPFPCRLKLEKSLETCCVNFFFAWADILSEKNPYFGRHLFCKTKTDCACKLRVQDFTTGKNLSFNQCSKQESFAFFSQESYFIKAIENFFPVFAYPDINTPGVGRILDSYANPRRTISISPNPSHVYIRLRKHGQRFLLLNFLQN